MVDTLVVWEAIGNAAHLGPNYGKKAWLMRDGEQSRLHKARLLLLVSATPIASKPMLSAVDEVRLLAMEHEKAEGLVAKRESSYDVMELLVSLMVFGSVDRR